MSAQPDDQFTHATSRRAFLAGAAGIAGLTAAAIASRAAAQEPSGGTEAEAEAAAADGRTFSGGGAGGGTDARLAGSTFGWTLGGSDAGSLKAVTGGAIVADVISEKITTGTIAKKHIAGFKYEDLSVQLNLDGPPVVHQWIQATWTGAFARRSGEIVAADFQRKVQTSAAFTDALLTEVTLPACDASSKDPGYLTVKFSPETLRYASKGGQLSQAKQQQRAWLPSNFRLKIDGLPTSRVSKVEALTIKQKVVESAVGEARDYEKEPASLEFPNLVVTLSAVDAADWVAWHEDFVVKGNNGEESERSGSLEYLSANRTDVLLQVDFKSLGIFRITNEKGESGADSIRRIKAEMYCEEMRLNIKGLSPDEIA